MDNTPDGQINANQVDEPSSLKEITKKKFSIMANRENWQRNWVRVYILNIIIYYIFITVLYKFHFIEYTENWISSYY